MLDIVSIEDPHGLRLDGELDLATAQDLMSALEPHLREGGDIVLDVSELRFMASAGVQVLINALQTLDGRGRLVLMRPVDGVQRLIAVMGLLRFDNLEVRS
jgi:anti-anti-sigma factor